MRRCLILVASLAALGLAGCPSPVEVPDAFVPPDASDGGLDAPRSDAGLPDVGSDAFEPVDVGVDAFTLDAFDLPDVPVIDDVGMDAFALPDAGSDAGTDAGSDAGTDAGNDAGTDAGSDAGSDAALDAGPLPMLPAGVCHDDGGTVFHDVYVAPDGTTTLVGHYENNLLREPSEGLIVQLAPSGALRWHRRLGGAQIDSFVEVLPMPDGVLAIGTTQSVSGGTASQGWLVRLDADGNVLGELVFGTTENVVIASAILTSDGGVLLMGRYRPATNQQAWVAKLDAALAIEWQLNAGTSGIDDAISGAELPDGYLVAGRTQASGTDAWLFRLDRAGAVLWQARYNFLNTERVWSTLSTSSGVYLVGDCNSHAWVTHIQVDGSVDWSRTIDDTLVGDEFLADAVTIGDDVIVVGDTTDPTNWYDFFLMRIDPTGAVAWHRSIGEVGADRGEAIARHPDGSYVVTGWTSSFGSSATDPRSWVTRVAADGTVDTDCVHPSALAFEDRALTRTVTTAVFAAGTVTSAPATSASAPSGVRCEPTVCTP